MRARTPRRHSQDPSQDGWTSINPRRQMHGQRIWSLGHTAPKAWATGGLCTDATGQPLPVCGMQLQLLCAREPRLMAEVLDQWCATGCCVNACLTLPAASGQRAGQRCSIQAHGGGVDYQAALAHRRYSVFETKLVQALRAEQQHRRQLLLGLLEQSGLQVC